MRETILQGRNSCFAQKAAKKKNPKQWRNQTFLKIGHLAKAIGFAEWSVWVTN